MSEFHSIHRQSTSQKTGIVELTHCPGRGSVRKVRSTATNDVPTSYKVCFLRGEVADETGNIFRLSVNLDGSPRDELPVK
jgi:hypothetical protein